MSKYNATAGVRSSFFVLLLELEYQDVAHHIVQNYKQTKNKI